MIGSGLKKYAKELGFKIEKGVAYGICQNYMTTFCDGPNIKAVSFAVHFDDINSKTALQALLFDNKFRKNYRIIDCTITDNLVHIVFHDTIGTMKKLRAGTEAILEKMAELDIKGMDYCSECGSAFNGPEGKAVLVNGIAYCMHEGCFNRVVAIKEEHAEEVKSKGSALLGAVGAIIGAVLGSIPWAIAFYFGWFVGWLGFLIGIAAKKGYEIFKGKETKIKGFIILFVVIFAVVFAEYIAYLFGLWREFSIDPEFASYGFTLSDVSYMIRSALVSDIEFLFTFIKDILLGWLFAFLGIFSTLRNIFGNAKAVSSVPVKLKYDLYTRN